MSSSPQPTWPDPHKACLALAFDLDGPTGDAMLNGSIWRKPEYFGFGGYGPYRALPRILDLLDEYRIPTTFFVPAWHCFGQFSTTQAGKTGRNSARRLSSVGMRWRTTATN